MFVSFGQLQKRCLGRIEIKAQLSVKCTSHDVVNRTIVIGTVKINAKVKLNPCIQILHENLPKNRQAK